MKNNIYILIFFVLGVWLGFAEDNNIGAWGPITNHLQMNLSLNGGITEIKANANYSLLLLVTNHSANESFFSDNSSFTDPFDGVQCVVISPSGNDISPPQTKNLGGNACAIVSLRPHQLNKLVFHLGDLCKLNKVGTYKITAKKLFLQGETNRFILISNPIFVKVLPVK